MVRALTGRTRGLSLPEALFGAVLLSLLLIATLNIFPSALALVQRTRTESEARSLAQSLLNESAAQTFQSLELGKVEKQAPDGLEATLEVGTVDGVSPDRLKRLTAEVSFATRNGRATVKEEVYVHSVRR